MLPAEMDTRGTHLLIEYWGCEPDVLGNLELISRVMREAAEATGATVIESVMRKFQPYDADDPVPGVSGVLVLAESHLSIHTFPKQGYAAVDAFTCGKCKPLEAHRVLRSGLGAFRFEMVVAQRGNSRVGNSIRVEERSS